MKTNKTNRRVTTALAVAGLTAAAAVLHAGHCFNIGPVECMAASFGSWPCGLEAGRYVIEEAFVDNCTGGFDSGGLGCKNSTPDDKLDCVYSRTVICPGSLPITSWHTNKVQAKFPEPWGCSS
jgi:hypothetical protein